MKSFRRGSEFRAL